MANAYIIVYCLENFLRDFIDRKLTDFYGSDYESKNVSRKRQEIELMIEKRKNQLIDGWLSEEKKSFTISILLSYPML